MDTIDKIMEGEKMNEDYQDSDDKQFLDKIDALLNQKVVTEPHIKRLLNIPLDFSEFQEEQEDAPTLKQLLNIKESPSEICLDMVKNDKSLPIGLLKNALHSSRR